MGAQGSSQFNQFSTLPVTGLDPQNGLFVIFTPDNRYIRPSETVLILKEKHMSWSGDDCVITDTYQQKWFDISGPRYPEIRMLTDPMGQEIAQYQSKEFSLHGTAYITVQTNSGRWIVATVKQQGHSISSAFSSRCNADIFIHNPMQSLDYPSTDGLIPTIQVEGDIFAKSYDFMKNMGIANGNTQQLCKIAQVVREWGPTCGSYPNTYYLRIGMNVDIAFICMCAYALDELYSDDMNDHHQQHGRTHHHGHDGRIHHHHDDHHGRRHRRHRRRSRDRDSSCSSCDD